MIMIEVDFNRKSGHLILESKLFGRINILPTTPSPEAQAILQGAESEPSESSVLLAGEVPTIPSAAAASGKHVLRARLSLVACVRRLEAAALSLLAAVYGDACADGGD